MIGEKGGGEGEWQVRVGRGEGRGERWKGRSEG